MMDVKLSTETEESPVPNEPRLTSWPGSFPDSWLTPAASPVVNPLAGKDPSTSTRDFRIVMMQPPDKDRQMYPGMWLFDIKGPGYPFGHLYVANELSCGTHLIKILQAVRDQALTEGKA